jgi:hypothetical protein
MTDNQDWLDEVLRGARAPPVPDAGFADQVMRRLPSRTHVASQWLLPVSLALGAISAILVSGSGENVVSALQLLISEHHLSVGAFLPVVLVWAACAWALSESR